MTDGITRRTIRIDKTLWTRFGQAAQQLHTTRSELARSYVLWMLRTPGVRPPAQVPDDQHRDA